MVLTETYTSTKTRAEAVVDQIDMFLRYSGVAVGRRDAILEAVESKNLEGLGVYVTDDSEKRVLEASIEIDWDLHGNLVAISPTVRTDLPGWDSNAAPEIQVIGARFGKKAASLGRIPNYWVRFTSAVHADRAVYLGLCEELGVSAGSGVPDWKSTPHGYKRTIEDLGEVSASLNEAG